MPTLIKIVDLQKKFGDHWVTRGVNLEIPANKMTVIIGRSGEGKSVLLKQIIGLIKPDAGHIFFQGIDTATLTEKQLHEQYKKMGYVFQFAALLDSLTVFENVGISMLEAGEPEQKVLPLVKEKLAQVLLDEPTTGLDPITARVIHELMFNTQQKMNITSVVISHDLEIFKYADYVALLYEGQIKYFGEAKSIWESDNEYIYQFIRALPEGPIKTDVATEQKIKVSHD